MARNSLAEIAWVISGDGTTIVGEGINPSGYKEGWVARLERKACYSDCNGDGKLNVNDFICFQAKWRAGCP